MRVIKIQFFKFNALPFGTLDHNFVVTKMKRGSFERKDGTVVPTHNPTSIFNFETILKQLTEHVFSRIPQHEIEKFLIDKIG